MIIYFSINNTLFVIINSGLPRRKRLAMTEWGDCYTLLAMTKKRRNYKKEWIAAALRASQ
jgi:hypothetical protein